MTISGPSLAADEPDAPAPVTNPGAPVIDATEVLGTAEAAMDGQPEAEAAAPEDPALPQPEVGGPESRPESPTLAMADLAMAYPQLTARERDRADELLARPDGTGTAQDLKDWSPTATKATPACGPHVCVHYVTDTDDAASPLWAQATLTAMESVWDFEVNSLGYRPPASDGSLGGVPGRFDVYLGNIGPAGYYGYCAPEDLVRGQKFRAYAYCVLENDFTEFSAAPSDSLDATAAHEFFHAIQFNYDVFEDDWILEGTATWMEERYADSVNDNRQYLPYSQVSKPGVPLDTSAAPTFYGTWIFFEKISAKYGVRSVRNIWKRLDANKGAPDKYSIQGVKKFLASKGTTLPKFYASFAAGNLTPARSYSEGANYQPTKVADSFKLKAGRKSIRAQRAKLRHLTSKSYRFKPGKSLNGNWKLRINVDGPAKKTDPAAVARVYFTDGKVSTKRIKLKSGDGSVRVKFGRKVTKVTLTLVNASTRYRCFQPGGDYSCQGDARDDPRKFTFKATLVK
jgi:hypothetical protein